MGVVYKAENTSLRRTVALKFLWTHLASDDQARSRFLREAQAAAALSHPNSCAIQTVDEQPPFLEVEFIEARRCCATRQTLGGLLVLRKHGRRQLPEYTRN